MDPNETLKLIRTVAYRVANTHAHDPDGADLANMFLDLDSWLLNGGLMPESWHNRTPVPA